MGVETRIVWLQEHPKVFGFTSRFGKYQAAV